jgi:hypothetical protein
MHTQRKLAICGAGPVGLEAAITAIRTGQYDVTIIEKGQSIASNVEKWKHVSLFSPNSLNFSPTGLKILQEMGAPQPDITAFPTGESFIEEYLSPLTRFITLSPLCTLLRCTEVLSISRGSLSKGQYIGNSPTRINTKFDILVSKTDDGGVENMLCDFDAVIDATGSYGNPNWMGRGGIPAIGERALRQTEDICYTIPSLSPLQSASNTEGSSSNGDDETFSSNLLSSNHFMRSLSTTDLPLTTAVIGSGASAITSLNYLRRSESEKHRIVWITRRAAGGGGGTAADEKGLYNRVANDPLPQRDQLYALGNSLASTSQNSAQNEEDVNFRYVGGVDILKVEKLSANHQATSEAPFRFRLTVTSSDTQRGAAPTPFHIDVHNIVANVGYRPDTKLTEELQVHYCYATQGPMKLAASLMSAGGGGGDCLSQTSAGKDTLKNPEPRLYVIGMKSYGRGSAFLLKLGYEQVHHVLQLLEEDFGIEKQA